MKSSTKRLLTAGGIATAAILVIGGTATAASQITAHGLATGAANHRVIQNGAVHNSDLTGRLSAKIQKHGEQGPRGPKGDSYLDGAYYSQAVYDNGGNGWATVACDKQTDVAISGGIEAGDAAGNNGPVGSYVISSFPGRMDWDGPDNQAKTADDNQPYPNRLDGWVMGIHADANGVSDNPLIVWALCVPGLSVGSSVNHY